MRRVGDAVRRSESNPDIYGMGVVDAAVTSATDTFCYAYVVDATGPAINSDTSNDDYDLTKPVLCRRIVDDRKRSVLKVDASAYESVNIDLVVNDTLVDSFNPHVDTNSTLTDKLVAAGLTGAEGLIIGKYVYISVGDNTGLTLGDPPSNVVVSRCSEWVLAEEESFFLTKTPDEDLQPGDLVQVHFSQSQGGVIVLPDVTPAAAAPCCDIYVINSTDLQITIPEYINGVATGGNRVLNSTRVWTAELNRDLTYSIGGGFAKVLKGDYHLSWSAVSEVWARDVAGDLVFLDDSGRIITTDASTLPYVTINSATMVLSPDDGAGNLALDIQVDAVVTTS